MPRAGDIYTSTPLLHLALEVPGGFNRCTPRVDFQMHSELRPGAIPMTISKLSIHRSHMQERGNYDPCLEGALAQSSLWQNVFECSDNSTPGLRGK